MSSLRLGALPFAVAFLSVFGAGSVVPAVAADAAIPVAPRERVAEVYRPPVARHYYYGCPDRYSCYPLYGAYGPYGGAGFWGAYTGWYR